MANARVIPDALDPAETLAIEQRWLPKAGIIAIIAGILPLIAFVVGTLAGRNAPDDITVVKTVAGALTTYAAGEPDVGLSGRQAQLAQFYGDNATLLTLSAVLGGVALIMMGLPLQMLLRSAWRRRPSFPRWFFWAPVGGGIVFGVATITMMGYRNLKLADFASLAPAQRTNWAATDAFNAVGDTFGWLGNVGVVGQMFLAVGVGAAALSAMNVGLVTRLMGYLGVMLAATVILPLDPSGVLRALWFVALGVTLLGKWPGGRPAAWETGTPQPWPTRAEMMEAAERAREAQRSELDAPAPKPKATAGSGGRKRRK